MSVLLSLQNEHGIARCAVLLGVSKPTFNKKISEYKLTIETNKSGDQ